MNSSVELLILRASGRMFGLPFEHVEETMRPLPVQALPGPEDYVVGVSIIRGEPRPVVDLRKLLNIDPIDQPPRRLVALRVGEHRRVALLVDEVLGLRIVIVGREDRLPPLLESAHPRVIESLRIVDGELLSVLSRGQLVPDEVWTREVQQGAAS